MKLGYETNGVVFLCGFFGRLGNDTAKPGDLGITDVSH